MPTIPELLAKRAGIVLDILEETAELVGRDIIEGVAILEKRVNITCCNASSPAGLVQAETIDPWVKSGKYALGWVYFCVIALVSAGVLRLYHSFSDKVRTATTKEENQQNLYADSPDTADYEMGALGTDKSTAKFFPRSEKPPAQPKRESSVSSFAPLNNTIALIRSILYHPLPSIRIKKGWRPITFPPFGASLLIVAATAFVLCYCFIPQPLYWQSIRFGSPPIAIRSGMIAVAMMPWIVALSMKANFVSIITGIGHERLNVLHRWLSYIFLLLSLIHTVPFYITPVWDQGGMQVFKSYFSSKGIYIYGTGWAALVPLIFLCAHSLPILRRKFYEAFVVVHVPVSIILLGMLFWHCNNYLTSWAYLWATTAIWLASYVLRLFYLNFSNPWRMSWAIGEEAAITLLAEDAIKVTIPTQVKWRPGQFIYLRMPGISWFENHPFTITSLCSEDFPSAYGDEYKDMVVVFRPFAGFTKKVLESALDHGPWKTYRAFVDGPYGGMRRNMDSFDHVVLIAGGSGITALISHLLDLIKRMRDGKAVTKTIHVVWAMKRPEIMGWFREELRICREFAPPDSLTCQIYITAAKRNTLNGKLVSAQTPTRPVSMYLHDRVDDMFQKIANNRFSVTSSKRNSQLIREEADGDEEREKELRSENEDRIRPLPQAHLKPISRAHLEPPSDQIGEPSTGRSMNPDDYEATDTPNLPPHPTLHEKRRSRPMSLELQAAQNAQINSMQSAVYAQEQGQAMDFGFPSTPTEFQKNLMRFAFMPAAVRAQKTGWSTEWGRPPIPFMLKEMSQEWTGRRTCVFVCGPSAMREDVSNTIADMQKTVWQDAGKDELYLHTENYAL